MRKLILTARFASSVGVVVVVAVVSTVSAQQQTVQAPALSQSVSEATRNQVEGFERSLRGAIDSAAGRLHQRVREAFPGVPVVLRFQAEPLVTGYILPEAGPIFNVLIPAIEDIDLKMVPIWAALARQKSGTVATPTSGTVKPSVLIEGDPTSAPLFNPDQEYTGFMKQALINAMLDHALSVPVAAGQSLTVAAGELQTQPPDPFNPRSRTLILQMKAEDLTALRENRITRDEAKARIKESKFPN